MFKKALISTSDKSKLGELAKALTKVGCEIVSTGGTSAHLRDLGIPVREVAEETGFPEVMDGRVRTLHPRIHMALLARSKNPEDQKLLQNQNLVPFDLVVVNLYPFAKVLSAGSSEDELIENIDIGGPTLLRAAAKNFERITVLSDPEDYLWVIERIKMEEPLHETERKALASKVFRKVSEYDRLIAGALMDAKKVQAPVDLADTAQLSLQQAGVLRYGENPQQAGVWYRTAETGLHASEVLHGKPLSYNNILDVDAAVKSVCDIDGSACVAVKHTNPCGVATGHDIEEAVHRALMADPVSVFGGILAVNRKLTAEAALHIQKIFIECVIAPQYSEEALEILKKKRDLRILQWPEIESGLPREIQWRGVIGGMLAQEPDIIDDDPAEWQVKGARPSTATMLDIRLAWKVCAHLKSNAIALVSHGQTVGLGMGQVNRVDAVQQAVERMNKYHSGIKDVVAASDAFFPFPDSIQLLAKANIGWVIQPGGSIKDAEVLAEANRLGVSVILTGRRHFRH